MNTELITVDGNEAAARIAHATNEVIAIYPITPASPMGELSDLWSAQKRTNIFGSVPKVIEMQSEGGAAGAVHGSLQGGALTTTFTASQGLLLMIPNMFKIAGELSSCVIHVAARSVATHALSIFGDHSDVMAARGTGFAMLASSSVQEAHDFAMISQAATLACRVPFLHFFDGFRTSHEINKIELIPEPIIRQMIDEDLVAAHRARALNPDAPVLRGTAQNPDVFFQSREAANPFYTRAPQIVQTEMDRFAALTGRNYRCFDYIGSSDAERVVVMMGSGVGAAEEAIERLVKKGERVGLVKVRLYRPFSAAAFVDAIPASCRRVAVLDRTKEPGAPGEPLYLDVQSVLSVARAERPPLVVGGRYGLSSKELTPNMIDGVFSMLGSEAPRHDFTVGIVDDVEHKSLKWSRSAQSEPDDVVRAVFYGLGSDGTVGANKSTVKIMGSRSDLFAQGYFVYDSKKAGAVTVSHLRFSPRPIRSTYLVQSAQLVACHQFSFLDRINVLEVAAPGATFLLNSPYPADRVWDALPRSVQSALIEKKMKLHVIDAHKVAKAAGLGGRINTVMQTCYFALSGLISQDEAIREIKRMVHESYAKRGRAVVDRNLEAIDRTLAALSEVEIPAAVTSERTISSTVPDSAPDLVQRVTKMIIEGRGDLLPVSALPVDGTFVTGTAQYEKRGIALEIPIWDPEICTQCGLCPLVCPHAAIRMKAYPEGSDVVPDGFKSMPWKGKDLGGHAMTIQVAPDDCTGCAVCVDVCPAKSKEVAKHKAINMEPRAEHLRVERAAFDHFLSIPELPKRRVSLQTVKGTQLMEPLFEFSGACAGCGETPYLKLLTQLFGERLMVANATGCSSIFGGNLPTTPWSKTAEGCGPAWSNSLFEDNAEFGLGMALAVGAQEASARRLLETLRPRLGSGLVDTLLAGGDRPEIRARIRDLQDSLPALIGSEAKRLASVADTLVPRSVWIVGGDGWAYDIGFGGLDHVLASGENVNILVLDTEVYSNTGGQASKATPRGAVAKFAASGKPIGKKDLGMIAMAYGNVYVAQIALGANYLQTIKAFNEAESYPGTSLIIAYSTCIAHGIDMSTSMAHQKEATLAGFWPLYRYDPRRSDEDAKPFHLDSKKPTQPFERFAMKEARFAMLARSDPERSRKLLALAQADIDERWRYYEQLAGLERHPDVVSEGAS